MCKCCNVKNRERKKNNNQIILAPHGFWIRVKINVSFIDCQLLISKG